MITICGRSQQERKIQLTSVSLANNLTMFSWFSLLRTSNSLLLTSTGLIIPSWFEIFTAYVSPVFWGWLGWKRKHHERTAVPRLIVNNQSRKTVKNNYENTLWNHLVSSLVNGSRCTLPQNIFNVPNVGRAASNLHHLLQRESTTTNRCYRGATTNSWNRLQ